MRLPMIRMRGTALAAPFLLLVILVGCNKDDGGTSALPDSDGKAPPVLPKEQMGADGRPKHSSAGFDSARGAKPPR